jgi:hypothetical protein
MEDGLDDVGSDGMVDQGELSVRNRSVMTDRY